MSVISCRQIRQNPIEGERAHQPGSAFARSRTVPYLVVTDNPEDTEDIVLSSYLVPQLYEGFLGDPYSRCNSVRARQRQNLRYWDLTASYSTETPTAQDAEAGQPLGPTVKRRLDYYALQVPMQQDLDGDWVKNTAGLMFDPPPMVERNPWILTCERSEQVFNMSLWKAFHDHVNSTTFNGEAPGQVKCLIKAEERNQLALTFYHCTYVFIHNPLGWQLRLANQGFIEFIAGPNITRRITDSQGRDVAQPYPLTDLGQAVPESELDDTPPPLIFLPFKSFRSANFNALGLL